MTAYYRSLCFCLIAALCTSCDPTAKVDDIDYERLSSAIVGHAAPGPQEHILLMGVPGRFDPMIPLLKREIEAVGATYLGALAVEGAQPSSWSTDYVDDLNGLPDSLLSDKLSEVDLGIMMPGAHPGHMAYRLLQELLNGANRRTIHFHWSGAYDVNGHALPMTAAKDLFYQSVVLDTDYRELSRRQLLFEKAMRADTIRVTTPEGTNLSFVIGDRPVTRQDGDATLTRAVEGRNLIDREIELPAGAVRVAPIEESVNGIIAFPDSEWNGEMVYGLRMKFEKGWATEIFSDEGLTHVLDVIKASKDFSARYFREFALGMNPLLIVQEDESGQRWIPHYGYGAGMVRLSLGDNTELGGVVGGGFVRWNFFPNATVWIGNDLWVKDGQMVQ